MTTVVGYYTAGGIYEREAARLTASLLRVGMRHSVCRIPKAPDWDAAVAQKPVVLQIARDVLQGGMLYIDVDAVVHEDCSAYFDALEGRYDFAAHWFQGPSGGYDRTRNDDCFLSGTMWFGDTPQARALLEAWLECNALHVAAGELIGGGQANLCDVLTDGVVKGLRIHRLPGRYCWVFDKPWAYPAGEYPVIEHLIASRENRGASNGKVNRPRRERIAELDREVFA